MIPLPKDFVTRIEAGPLAKTPLIQSLDSESPISIRLNPRKRSEQFENEEGISKVYLFTTKKTTPPIYQALAANYNNRLRFAVVK